MTDDALGHVCPPSVVRWLNSPLRSLIQNPKKMFGKYVDLGDTVIDLGCGGGFFTLALAKMVGESGRVIAVDMQQDMLDITRRYVTKKGVLDRITLHQCEADALGLTGEKADFVLAFYMVHEVPDRTAFFRQVVSVLKPNACFMVIEPKFHVTAAQFGNVLEEARQVGFKQAESIQLPLSRGVLLRLT